ncbi:hypothetical protein N0V93_005224 [Gnomoniopsis smithogilvyi]|uniref:Uncharacterized protein n=1 Tax=Gnomoniopsis smithogilvyi TaxID=1191159 RepID=A0A9W8YU66_9PEZI|nr:hypothetical protein N0V93_005224 [Gnomoniopsis smithogilvyi]
MADSSNLKEAVMRQVQIESNTANVRILMEAKNERVLLREMRAKTWIVIIKRRERLFHRLHGQIHGRVEPSQLSIYNPHKERAGVEVNERFGDSAGRYDKAVDGLLRCKKRAKADTRPEACHAA